MSAFEFPYIPTLIAGGLSFLLGLFWYHPKIMGERWLIARGKTAGDMKPEPTKFVISFLLWILAACFYSFLVSLIGVNTVPGFFSLSCLLWVAFAMPPLVMGALYTGYSIEAVSVDAAYHLAGYYVFAIVHIVLGMVVV